MLDRENRVLYSHLLGAKLTTRMCGLVRSRTTKTSVGKEVVDLEHKDITAAEGTITNLETNTGCQEKNQEESQRWKFNIEQLCGERRDQTTGAQFCNNIEPLMTSSLVQRPIQEIQDEVERGQRKEEA